MKIICTTLLFLFSSQLFAQFGIIHDKDGYSNVRSDEGTNNKIIDTLGNGHFVFCFATRANWTDVDYTKNNKEKTGKIYYDRIKQVGDYTKIPLSAEKTNALVFSRDSIRVTVEQQAFNKSKYRFSYDKDCEKCIRLINGKKYWGTDGEVPHLEYKSIRISIGKRNIILPTGALQNLFEPGLYTTQINYDQGNDILLSSR